LHRESPAKTGEKLKGGGYRTQRGKNTIQRGRKRTLNLEAQSAPTKGIFVRLLQGHRNNITWRSTARGVIDIFGAKNWKEQTSGAPDGMKIKGQPWGGVFGDASSPVAKRLLKKYWG